MRVYVLNLARAVERRRAIREAAAMHGISLSMVEAVDGRSLTAAQRDLVDHQRRKRISPFPLTDGEIGCWLSHRRALEALVASGDSMAAVVEDDVCFTPDFVSVLGAIHSHGGIFDLITLHRNEARRERFVECRRLLPGIALGRIGYMQTGNVGYVITRRAAKKFLAATPRLVHAVDKEMHRFWASGLDIYALSRPVVVHDDHGYSYLDETRLAHSRQARTTYPEADRFYWRLQRLGSKVADSIAKRAAFPSYARLGRVDDWEKHLSHVRRMKMKVKLHNTFVDYNPLRLRKF